MQGVQGVQGSECGVKGPSTLPYPTIPYPDPTVPVQGQGQGVQGELYQPSPTLHPHVPCITSHISAIGIMIYALIYMLHTATPVTASVWFTWSLAAACASVVGPPLITAATHIGKRMHSAYITADDKHLKVFIAILAMLFFLFSPWSFISKVGFPTQFISAHSTEFVLCSATSSSPSINVVGVFNSFLGTDVHDATRITVGPDTFADVSLISPDVVQTHWKRVQMPPMSVSGIGGLAPTISEAVQVPLQLQWGARPVYVYAYVAKTPKNVDLLMGCDILDFLQGTVDRKAKRAVFAALKLAVPIETIADNLKRVASAPLTVLSTCSGCNYVYCVMRNLGFTIGQWCSIENDPACRAVTATIVPKCHLCEPRCHGSSSGLPQNPR